MNNQGGNGFKNYIQHRYGYQTARLTANLQEQKKKRARINNHKVFLIRCRNNKICPRGLRVNLPRHLQENERMKRRKDKFQQKIVREELQKVRSDIWRVNKDIRWSEETCTKTMSLEDLDTLHRITSIGENTEYQKIKRTQTNKFEMLKKEKMRWQEHEKREKERQRCGGLKIDGIIKREVVDLTKDGISDNVKEFLALGPDFAITPKEFPVEDYIAATENICHKIELEFHAEEITEQQKINQQQKIRRNVQELLKKEAKKPIRQNLNTKEKKGKVEAERDKKRVFLPADKGKGMVVMDKYEKDGGTESYEFKMKKVLEEMKAKKLTRRKEGEVQAWDITELVSRKARNVIDEIVKKGEMSSQVGDGLKPNHRNAPRLRGVVKVHKKDNTLRGIVSMVGSPFEYISNYLVPILKKLQGRSGLYVKNSKELKEKIEMWEILENDVIVSYDVKSMYPSIPIPAALALIKKLLQTTEEWKEGKDISVESVMKLLEWVFERTYCEFWGEYYELKCGPIGLGVTGEVAAIYMEDFQIRSLELSREPPKGWAWYVDDSEALMTSLEHGNRFLEHLNSLEPGIIEFTMEVEQDGKIPVLDLLQQRGPEGIMTYGVYYKPTNTNIMIKEKSNHAPAVKRGIIGGFAERARKLCSEETKQNELDNVKKMFVANGYDKNSVEKMMQTKESTTEEEEEETQKSGVSVEYVKGVSEKFRSIINDFDFRVAFKSGQKVKDLQNKAKQPLGEKKNNVVYRIECKCEKAVYIGETKQRFEERRQNHKDRERLTRQDLEVGRNMSAEVRMGKMDAGLTRHSVLKCQNEINWKDAKPLTQERIRKKRKIKESIETMKEKLKGEKEVLNKCDHLDEGYKQILMDTLII